MLSGDGGRPEILGGDATDGWRSGGQRFGDPGFQVGSRIDEVAESIANLVPAGVEEDVVEVADGSGDRDPDLDPAGNEDLSCVDRGVEPFSSGIVVGRDDEAADTGGHPRAA